MIRGLRFAAAALVTALALAGCATEDIIVSEVAMTDRPDAPVLGWTASEEGREVFSPEDEEVIVKVLFNFNYRGVYEWYKVEWIAPGGEAYQVVSRRTDFASHRDLQANLKVRGKMASRLPGVWRVKVSLLGREGAPDRLLVSRLFRIAEPSEEMLAAGLTPVDAPRVDTGRPLANYASAPAANSVPDAPPAKPAPVTATASVAVANEGAAVIDKSIAAAPKTASGSALATDSGSGAAVAAAKSKAASAPPPAAVQGILPPLAVVGAATSMPAATTPSPIASAATSTPTQATRAAASGSAPPSLVASGQSVAPSSVPKAAPKVDSGSAVAPLPTESGISSISLRSVPAAPGKVVIPQQQRVWEGCPPLYYRPGPGCVEQAPQE